MTTKDRPLIGMNLDVRHASKGHMPFSCILSGYYDTILTSGGIPVLLPPLTKSEDMLPLVDRLDGIVLIGGDDMDPRKQNVPFHASVKIMSDRRETSDRLLCKLAQQRRLPTLAIGLGMQEMNVANGGTLHVHVPEAIPKCLPHRDPHGGSHRHVVIMEPGTAMEEIYGEGEILVNSYHHQGVNKLAPIFRPAAFSPDGLLEAYEHHDLGEWWCVGVQWHPENEGHITLDTQLIEAFIASSSKWTKKPALAKAG